MWARVPTRSALLNSMSTAQQHCGYLIDYHQSQLKRESRRMKTSTAMDNHDPRMNRTNPKYHALWGVVGTEVPRVISAIVCCLPCGFLIVFAVVLCVSWMCVVLCAHDWLGLSALQTPLACKTPNRKTSQKCVSLPSIYDSLGGIRKLLVNL
jgi:hypothetical protein